MTSVPIAKSSPPQQQNPGFAIPVAVLRGHRDKKVTRSFWYNWGRKYLKGTIENNVQSVPPVMCTKRPGCLNTLFLLLSWRPYYLGLPIKHDYWPQSTQVKNEIQRFASVFSAGQIPPPNPQAGTPPAQCAVAACALSPAPPAPSKTHAALCSLQSAYYIYFILTQACKIAK